MKTTNTELQHITGWEAYVLYWEQLYKCRPRLKSIMAIDRNLEIITDADLSILAYRHDPPEDMMWMVINAGHWQIIGQENLSSELLEAVRGVMVGITYNCCKN